MRETVYYQRGATDPILEDALVLDIVRQYELSAGKVKQVDESGGEARTYAVDDNIILKVQRPQQLRSSTSLEKEVFFLRQLEQHTDASVPRVLGYGRHETVEYTCMTRIPGVAAERVKLTHDEKNNLLLALGRELRKIHDLNQQSFIDNGLFPQDEPADLAERLRRRYQNVIRGNNAISQDRQTLALNQIEEILQRMGTPGGFVALHVNPYMPHVFVDETTHKYSGIIDFGDSYIGHPIFDMWYWSVSSRKTLLRGYTSEKPVTEAFQTVFESASAIGKLIESL
jgi:hygromycin-B 7''-O-kinase